MHKRKTIEEVENFIILKGGKCLSDNYVNSKVKIRIMCENGHIWETNWSCLSKKTWCPHCNINSKKLSIAHAEEIAKKRNGYCLSTEYKNSQAKLKWKCEYDHIWEANLTNIKNQNQWCPACIGRRPTIEEMCKLAKQNGGKCLSNKYINSNIKLDWQCKEGHIWKAVPSSIKNAKSWCPHCKESRGENACRIIFEEIYARKFPKTRPKWLKNKDGYNLELDGFNTELKIAFEYNGLQHRKISQFAKDKSELNKILQHDLKKKEATKAKGIKLIIIEQDVFDLDDLINKIELLTEKKSPSKDFILSKINKSSKINELKNIAKSRGGQCLSEIYINSSTNLKWKCKKGHEWTANPNTIKNGHWCQKCGLKQKCISDMHEIAKERKGKCLSDIYSGMLNKLSWECDLGHIWQTRPSNIIHHGTWCPKCANKNKGIRKNK